VTRIPQLEQELVAAATRLQSRRRRLVRPAARAALAAGAVVAVLVLAVVLSAGNDGDQRSQPPAAQPSPPNVKDDGTQGAALPARQKIARTANKWARLFAFSDFSSACEYMTQPACERESCVRVGPEPVPNCTLPSPAFRLSFARAKVEDVEIKGNRAAARFSNGEVAELERVTRDNDWLINTWGRNAGHEFFD
jgi:hypothetical protein